MRKQNALLLSVALLATIGNVIVPQDAEARGKSVRRRAANTYLVPPPPAYAPSIMPARYQTNAYAHSTNTRLVDTDGQAVESKSSNIVRTYGSAQNDKAVRVNKYVTNWNS